MLIFGDRKYSHAKEDVDTYGIEYLDGGTYDENPVDCSGQHQPHTQD